MVGAVVLTRRVCPRLAARDEVRGDIAAEEDGPGRVVFWEGWEVFQKERVSVIVIAIAVAFAKVSVGSVFAAAWRRRAFEGWGQDGEHG